MVNVIRFTKLAYRDNKGNHLVSFKVTFDDVSKVKRYYVIMDSIYQKEVTQEEWNEIFKELRREYPDSKEIVIIDNVADDIIYRRVFDHYEVIVNGKFNCSCDDIEEVMEAVKGIGGNYARR